MMCAEDRAVSEIAFEELVACWVSEEHLLLFQV